MFTQYAQLCFVIELFLCGESYFEISENRTLIVVAVDTFYY